MSSASIMSEIKKKKKEKEKFEKRKKQTLNAQKSIPDYSEDYISHINKKIENAIDHISDGIKGLDPIESGLITAMFERKEPSYATDGYLSVVSSNLSSEVSDCEKRIGELDEEIASLQIQYEQAKAAEREAARKAAEEAAAKLADKLNIFS